MAKTASAQSQKTQIAAYNRIASGYYLQPGKVLTAKVLQQAANGADLLAKERAKIKTAQQIPAKKISAKPPKPAKITKPPKQKKANRTQNKVDIKLDSAGNKTSFKHKEMLWRNWNGAYPKIQASKDLKGAKKGAYTVINIKVLFKGDQSGKIFKFWRTFASSSVNRSVYALIQEANSQIQNALTDYNTKKEGKQQGDYIILRKDLEIIRYY